MGHDDAADRSRTHVPVPSGRGYRVCSPPASAVVTRALAEELRRVLERFAADAGFSDARPVGVFFRPGVVGHHRVGRAADIYATNAIGLDVWKARWDSAMARARQEEDPAMRAAIVRDERRQNLGWRLYKDRKSVV